ncbi:MAG: TonB-dependent receptor plug domain-containing protein, partial [Vicingaceae bacterium]
MQISFAQEKKVSGTVSDDNGLPLAGSTVIIKGTTTGVSTDFDGKYSINANLGSVLTFSYVGYADQTQTIGTSDVVNVTMQLDNSLEEIVVVGYGTSTKEAFTGTATKIETENIEAKAVGNISQALRGEVAGVNVVTGSGAPGSDATIRIRGFGSINGNRSPLYIVDGAPYASDISAINPSDIASLTILKDAAATSIYGSRGANGVIVITTKKGKVGTSVVSVDIRTSINTLMLPNYQVIESPEEYIELSY